jgi:hypothetical protein
MFRSGLETILVFTRCTVGRNEVIGALVLRYCNPEEDVRSVDNCDFVHV